MKNGNSEEVDVCFILEGTYPYISGGVSTWVHQAIMSMPDLRFAIHYIGAQKVGAAEPKYEIPENVVSIVPAFIFDDNDCSASGSPGREVGRQLNVAFDLLGGIFSDSDDSTDAALKAVACFEELAGKVSFETFWQHPLTWNFLQKTYREYYPDESFSMFFWNTKFLIKPVWELLRSFRSIPRAKVYHSVSTGYAGFLASVAKQRLGGGFLLSEHGIYVRERINDLLTQEWNHSLSSDFVRPPAGVSLLRQAWIDFFIYLGKFCYDSADHITSLFERNAQFQEEFGADRKKIEIIPNGIDPARFEPIARDRESLRKENPGRKTVGFLGRIVSIKDVRTLIRAARLTCDAIPDAEFLLVGPTDEDPSYHEGCQHLIKELGLESNVLLTGPKNIAEALPLFDVMVLSSISEGLPFAVLESFAAGIPVVSTDVGACSELIYGFEGAEEDAGGIVVPVADAAALADAIKLLLRDRSLQDVYGGSGRKRVYQSYRENDVMNRFKSHYINLGQSVAERVS